MKKIHRLITFGALLGSIIIAFNITATYSWFTTVGTAAGNAKITGGRIEGEYCVAVNDFGVPGEEIKVPIAIKNTGTGAFIYEIDVNDLIKPSGNAFLANIDSVKIDGSECSLLSTGKYYGKIEINGAEKAGELVFTFRGDAESYDVNGVERDWNDFQNSSFDLNVTVKYCQDNQGAAAGVFGLSKTEYDNIN